MGLRILRGGPLAYLWDQAENVLARPGDQVGPPREETMEIDQDKLMEFLHRFVSDLGATMAAGNVLVGDRLGFVPFARREADAPP